MLLLLSAALAYDSEPQALVFEDDANVFQAIGFSTGYVPAGSPLQVQFAIESVGGATVSMEGDALLSWPEALVLDYVGAPGTGTILLDASIDAVTSVAIDLSDWGYYGTFEIDRRSFTMDAWDEFEPLVLDGSAEPRVELVDPGDAIQLIEYSFEIIAGLSLDFTTDLRAEARAGFEGYSIRGNDQTMVVEGQHLLLGYERTSDLLVETRYTAAWDSALDLVFTPALEACADPFGCFTVLEFELPINLVSDSFLQDFPDLFPVFPLPLLEVGLDQADFGDVDVGTVQSVEVPLLNDGSLLLEGTATIEGSGDFTVFPETFSALPGSTDGVVVSFRPNAEGPQSASLVLTSSDPGQPEVVIPLVANGFVPETDEGEDVDDSIVKPLDGCGCASRQGSSAGVAGLLVALSALWVRRRRR